MNNIIFYHIDQPTHYARNIDYFHYIVETARKYNPDATIHIISDNNRTESKETLYFRNIYRHSGTNPHDFEIECILRWFYIYNYCKQNGIDSFLHLDSDTMLLTDISNIEFTHAVETNIVFDYINCPEIVSDIICPHCHFINNVQILEKFIDLAIDSYSLRNYDLFKIEKELKRWGVAYGLSDMFIWGLLCKNNRTMFKSIKGVINNTIFDTAIEDLEYMESYGGIKKIIKLEDNFYCIDKGHMIKFNCIHWHGGFKRMVKDFYKKNIV